MKFQKTGVEKNANEDGVGNVAHFIGIGVAPDLLYDHDNDHPNNDINHDDQVF